MFLKLNGVDGESKDKTHKKEIDVLSWSWGMANSGTAHVGGGAGAGKVSVQDLGPILRQTFCSITLTASYPEFSRTSRSTSTTSQLQHLGLWQDFGHQ